MEAQHTIAASYDRLAAAYAQHVHDELRNKPFDRAFLDRLAVMCPTGPVLDLGCGPGQVAAHLAQHGVVVSGLDISAAMVDEARRLHPDIGFVQGDMHALPCADGALAGIVAFYAIVHLAPAQLPRVFKELRRALQTGGLLALSFHVGDEVRHVEQLWGVAAGLDFIFHTPAQVQSCLRDAGFDIRASTQRAPYDVSVEAQTQRCYILASAMR